MKKQQYWLGLYEKAMPDASFEEKLTLTRECDFDYMEISIDETDAQTAVIADWLNQELTPENFEKSQALFESLVDAVSTNISINDFARYTNFLEKASDRERPIKAQKTVFDEDL